MNKIFGSLCLCTFLIVASSCNSQKQTTQASENFTESQAVNMVLKEHSDFPQLGVVKKINTFVGGAYPGSTINGEMQTKIDKSPVKNTYFITLIKDWEITVNGKPVSSYWKYEVTPTHVELLSSEDNEQLLNTIK